MIKHNKSSVSRFLVLTMFLVLSGCDFESSLLPSSSEDASSEASSSEGSSSSSSSSDSSSSSSSFTLEIPPDGEFIDGMSSTWPSQIIEGVFTSQSRLTIPPFASTTYIYEYSVNPDPGVAIMAMTTLEDPTSVYTDALISAGWTIHDEIIPLLGFPVAVDPLEELMIAYLSNSGAIIINITLLDPEFFEGLGLYESDVWPSAEINAYLENDGADLVVPFPSEAPYYYILPTEENNVFFLMTQATEEAFNTYLSDMMIAGWGYEQDGLSATFIDPEERITLFLTYANGNVTIIIALSDPSEEPEIFTSQTWPADAVAEFLVPSFVKIPIPTFEASLYYYFGGEDEYNPYLSIFAEYSTSLIDDYVTSAIGAGWDVQPIQGDPEMGYYAVDPDFEIILCIQEGYPYFTLTMWVFSAQLEYFFESGVASWQDSNVWPSDAIESFLSETPSVAIPPYSADFYSYRIENDAFGAYLAIKAYTTSADAAEYQDALIASSFHVTTQAVGEDLMTVAWDPAETVMIFFYFSGDQIFFAIRDYDAALIEEEPELPPADTMMWPLSEIGSEFGPEITGMIPILNASLGYLVDCSSLDEMAYIAITALGVTYLELGYYLDMLANQQYVVKPATGLASETYTPFIAKDAQNTIMILMAECEYGILVEVMPYDEATYTAMTAFESGTTEAWPSSLITSTFSESFLLTIPVFSSESIFSSTLYYAGSELTPWIQIASDQTTLAYTRLYVASLFDANWSLESLEDEIDGVYSYLLVDPTQTVMLVIHFSDGYMPFMTIDMTEYSETAYQEAYDSIFPQQPM